ncbi:MAG TPA: methyltransferase [Verrucomicrobiae bacterium]|nr:methyltransferase [Verrucomicrobiae bacterium]
MFVSFLLPYIDRGQGPLFQWVMMLQAASIPPEELILVADDRYLKATLPWDADCEYMGFKFHFPSQEVWDRIQKYSLPAALFTDLEGRSASMLEAFRILLTEDYPPLRDALEKILAEICQARKPEAVLSWCHVPSLKRAVANFGIPIIHNELGPLRAPLYQGTVYFDFKGVNGFTSAADEMNQFAREAAAWNEFAPLSLQELRELLIVAPDNRSAGSMAADFKAGAALQVEDDSNLLAFGRGMSNFHLIFAARKGITASELLVRQHPGGHALYSAKLGVRDHSRDAIQFLSRCEQVFTANSSIAFECLLQEKPVTILGDSPAAALSHQRLTTLTAQKQLLCLNWLFIGHLVPARLLFDREYYAWRLTNPSLREIYETHLKAFRAGLKELPARATTPGRKMLVISHDASRTGAPISLLTFLRWLRHNSNWDFRIVLRAGGPLESEFRDLGETQVVSELQPGSPLLEDVSLIYSNTCTNGLFLNALSGGDIPIVTHIHELNDVIGLFGRENLEAVLGQTTHYIACSEAVAQNLRSCHGVSAQAMSVHYEGICAETVRQRAQAARQDRAALGLAEDSFVIAACGFADWRKGPDLFIQMAASLRRKTEGSRKVEFIWIGQVPSDERGRMLLADLERPGLAGDVRFVGEQANPHLSLSACNLFCLPSREDPFPLVMLEAAALGKPLVCFAGCGGAEEFCRLGGGFSVPSLDVEALSSKCAELIGNDFLLQATGQTAARLANEIFDIGVLGPKLIETLQPFAQRAARFTARPRSVPPPAPATCEPHTIMEHPASNPANPRQLPARSDFDNDAYLALHPDVAAAVRSGAFESGWAHFEQHGFNERRRWVSKKGSSATRTPSLSHTHFRTLTRPAGTLSHPMGEGRGEGLPVLNNVIQEISSADEMFTGNKKHYFGVGESALHCIETALFAARREKSTIKKILDLPCGHGRVMRFLKAAFPEARLTACDINRDGVDFCSRTFGAVPVPSEVEVRNIPLREKFDLIWCGSLLTHLREEKCAEFIQLFQRLLDPGGILVFTTHGRCSEIRLATGINKCGLQDPQVMDLLGQYRRRGFGYVDYNANSGYGISLSLPAFIIANYIQDPHWKLLGYQEKGWDNHQDAICLQKLPAGEFMRLEGDAGRYENLMAKAPAPTASQSLPSAEEFDEEQYLKVYPDVAEAVRKGAIQSGWRHFRHHGVAEGRRCFRKNRPVAWNLSAPAQGESCLSGTEPAPARGFVTGEPVPHAVAINIAATLEKAADGMRMGHTVLARLLLEEALEAEPGNAEALALLAKLKSGEKLPVKPGQTKPASVSEPVAAPVATEAFSSAMIAACAKFAKRWGVSPEVHPEDFIFRFIIAHSGFASKDAAIQYYFDDGAKSAQKLRKLLAEDCHLDVDTGNLRLLEFASGYGAVTRHLKGALPACRIIGCDIHPEAIRFVQSLGVEAAQSAPRPEDLHFDTGFDVVFALSFFSHMPKSSFGRWLHKLASVLKPGGHFIFTTHGMISRKSFPDWAFDKDGFYFVPFSEQKDLSTAEYGSTVVKPQYVYDQLARIPDVELVAFHEGFWWEHQDTFVIRRKPSASNGH